jgi:hypothetical protein
MRQLTGPLDRNRMLPEPDAGSVANSKSAVAESKAIVLQAPNKGA